MTTHQAIKKVQKREALSEKRAYGGLCLTCVNAPVCIYIKNQKSAVLLCEEFNGYANPPRKAIISNVLSKTTSDGWKADFEKYKGLCANCEIRETCEFPKSEGGVWHCEEYR